MSKKALWALVLVMSVVLPVSLFATGAPEAAKPAAAGPVHITLWDFLSGGDGVRWKEILDSFNSSQNKLVVDHTTLTWGDPFYTKVHTAVVAGQTPDVMTYHLSHFPAGIKAGDLRPFTQDELKQAGLPLSDFSQVLVERSLSISKAYGVAGDVYGVPLDTHTSVLLPAYLPVLTGPAMADMVPNNEYSDQAAKDAVFEPVTPVFGVGTPAMDAVGNFLTPALVGQLTVDDAIAKFKAQLLSYAQ